jgi:hypothetical protein
MGGNCTTPREPTRLVKFLSQEVWRKRGRAVLDGSGKEFTMMEGRVGGKPTEFVGRQFACGGR